MDRVIKFRAWQKLSERMIYQGQNDVVLVSEFVDGNFVFRLGEQDYDWEVIGASSWYDDILMQFTGMHDCNGKEIYEGDIVKYLHHWGFNSEEGYEDGPDDLGGEVERIEVVKFENGQFTPREHAVLIEEDSFYSWRDWNFEVIGNIYENPELLPTSY